MATFALPFCEIPEDLQLQILSFLTPAEIFSFSCTSKRFASLCQEDEKIWHVMCDRRWGKKTKIQKWGNGQVAYRIIYKTLKGLENLIGFWRLCGRANPEASSPPLVFFDWGPSFVLGSRVSSTGDDTYKVKKTPFLYLGISSEGRSETFLDLSGNLRSAEDITNIGAAFSSDDLVPVDVNFMGNNHIMVEENRCFTKEEQRSSGDESDDVISSPNFSEMYTQMANQTSPGGERRRQRRKMKEREASRTKWEPEHFIKVADCSPTPTKPLQGLWKGFCEQRNMELYLVKYDEVGGIICRKVEDLSLSRHTSPVFWTPNHSFIRTPFSAEDELLLNSRIHISPLADLHENVVSGMMIMNSSYDLVLQGEAANGGGFRRGSGFRRGEGRVWLYENGTFGFGFLRDQFIIDMKRVALEDGCLADEVEP